MKNSRLSLGAFFFVCFFMGCAAGVGGIGSMSKTNELKPGLSSDEVKQIFGRPSSTQFANGFLIWKYSLQKPFVGWVPFYLAFDPNSRLVGWQENLDEYYANQQLWLSTLPKTYNVNVNETVSGEVDHHVSGSIQHFI